MRFPPEPGRLRRLLDRAAATDHVTWDIGDTSSDIAREMAPGDLAGAWASFVKPKSTDWATTF